MQYAVKMTHEDCLKLQKLYYEVEARGNLFKELSLGAGYGAQVTDFYNQFMREYLDLYGEYLTLKLVYEQTYKPEEIKETAKSWHADFLTESIIFEV